MRNMKKITLFKRTLLFACGILLATFSLVAHNKTISNSYVILDNKTPGKTDFYKKSIEAADLEQYRLRDQRVKLVFDNGFEVELFSAKELFVNGVAINPNSYTIFYKKGTALPVFNV